MRWFVLAGLVACGDNATPISTAPTNGFRLHTTSFVFEDGTRLPNPGHYYDAGLQAHCVPSTWSDGLTYCTPDTDLVSYTDADCTRPIGTPNHGVAPRPMIRPYSLDGTDIPSRMYLAVDATTASDVFRFINGECLALGTGNDFDVYEVREVDPVGLSTVQVGMVTLQISDDGMRIPIGLADPTVGACEVDQGSLGAAPCRPAAIEAQFFADAACGTAEAAIPDDLHDDAIVSVGGTCGRYFLPGTHVGPFPLFKRTDAGCVAASDTPQTLYALGPELELPTVEVARRRSEGTRLEHVLLETGGESMLGSWLYDPVLGAACQPVVGPRQVTCRPASVPSLEAYRDSGCTSAIRVAEVPAVACGPTLFADGDPAGVLGNTVDVYTPVDVGVCVQRPARPGFMFRQISESHELLTGMTAVD